MIVSDEIHEQKQNFSQPPYRKTVTHRFDIPISGQEFPEVIEKKSVHLEKAFSRWGAGLRSDQSGHKGGVFLNCMMESSYRLPHVVASRREFWRVIAFHMLPQSNLEARWGW